MAQDDIDVFQPSSQKTAPSAPPPKDDQTSNPSPVSSSKTILDPKKAPPGCRVDYALKKYVCLDGRVLDPSSLDETSPETLSPSKTRPTTPTSTYNPYEYQQYPDPSSPQKQEKNEENQSKFRVGVDAVAVLPIVDGWSAGFGAIMSFDYKFNNNLGINLRGGYIKHLSLENTIEAERSWESDTVLSLNTSTVPIFLGFKAGSKVYFILDFGYVRQNAEISIQSEDENYDSCDPKNSFSLYCNSTNSFGGAIGIAAELGPIEIRTQLFVPDFDTIDQRTAIMINLGFRLEP
jgi:hypothetical protein